MPQEISPDIHDDDVEQRQAQVGGLGAEGCNQNRHGTWIWEDHMPHIALVPRPAAQSVIQVVKTLDLLQGHRVKTRVQDLLERKGLPASGTWEVIRKRVLHALNTGEIREQDLLSVLENVEAHGNQHIFLYRCNSTLVERLQQRSVVQAALDRMGYTGPINGEIALRGGNKPEIESVRLTARGLCIKWTEIRKWWEPWEEKEFTKGEETYLHKTYVQKQQRAAVYLRVHADSLNVELAIQRLERGSNYAEQRDRFMWLLRPLILQEALTPVSLAPGIKAILESNEVHARRGEIVTTDGCVIDLVSAGDAHGFAGNDFFQGGKQRIGGRYQGQMANVYWLPEASNGRLKERVHTIIHPRNEILFPAHCTQTEVEHVLRRVKEFAWAQT